MKSHARVAVIGGGAMGVSLLYHLAKRGLTDSVLIEKRELTAGSTWHAAGLCTHFAHSATVMLMRAHSVKMYREGLTTETGLPTGFHKSGALRITRSEERMNEFRHVQGIGEFLGYEFKILTPKELTDIYPLCHTEGIVGAVYEPNDGHVDPTLATNAMATAARNMGAEIVRHNPVLSLSRNGSGEWVIETEKGTLIAEHVVNAAGTWCREIGLMMGMDLPVVPMLHQYVVTAEVPEIEARIARGEPELPIIRDPEESWYLRQERNGYIVGPYEKTGKPWAIDGVPPAFGMELLPPDLDSVEHIIAQAMDRVPALGTAGIKTVVNGPITFTPDANPMVGPAFGVRNGWLLTGSSMGVMEGGGAGAFLADWIADGHPPRDALAIDGRRFGGYADRDYRVDKAVECFGLQFGVHFPFEEREAARLKRVTPAYDQQKAEGAVFGVAYGWERPNWFAKPGDAEALLTFRRPGWLDAVKRECLNVQERVGSVDLSAFSKFEVTGPAALAFVDSLGANRAPQRDGRVGLTHVLAKNGGVASEFTVTRLPADRFYLTSAAAAERHDEDLLRARAPDGVTITNVTGQRGILGLMGPKSRTLLKTLTDADLSDAAFPWLSAREITVTGIPVLALRMSYVGELGYELHVELPRFGELWKVVSAAGKTLGHAPFGIFAVNAMRLEKGYRGWGSDLTTERSPLESGLAALVKAEGRDFIGRDAMLARQASGKAWRMVLLSLADDHVSLPFYNHTVWQDGKPVGVVTSGGFGARTGLILALAYLTPDAKSGPMTVKVIDRVLDARVLEEPPYDPQNRKPRGLDHE